MDCREGWLAGRPHAGVNLLYSAKQRGLYSHLTSLTLHCLCLKSTSDRKLTGIFLISNFRPVLYVVCFLLGNSLASECYMPTFRNTLSVPSSWASRCEMTGTFIITSNTGICVHLFKHPVRTAQ